MLVGTVLHSDLVRQLSPPHRPVSCVTGGRGTSTVRVQVWQQLLRPLRGREPCSSQYVYLILARFSRPRGMIYKVTTSVFPSLYSLVY